jgi:hypothetical protein
MTTCKGHNGDITLEGETLTITRSGVVARATFGKDVELVVIPLQAIHGVRVKPASRLMNGWLQLLIGGVEAPELAIGTASSNGHTVMFTHKNREQFEGLRTWLDAVVAKNVAAGIDPSAFPVKGQGGQVGRFDALAAKAAAAAEQISAQQAVRASSQLAAGILFEGTSHDPGRNAKVTLHVDRLERVKEAKMASLSRAKQDVEVTPVRSITSVQASKDGMLYTKVTAFASGNNIEFRFGHDEAQRFKDTLMKLVLQGPPHSGRCPSDPAANGRYGPTPQARGAARRWDSVRGRVFSQEGGVARPTLKPARGRGYPHMREWHGLAPLKAPLGVTPRDSVRACPVMDRRRCRFTGRWGAAPRPV